MTFETSHPQVKRADAPSCPPNTSHSLSTSRLPHPCGSRPDPKATKFCGQLRRSKHVRNHQHVCISTVIKTELQRNLQTGETIRICKITLGTGDKISRLPNRKDTAVFALHQLWCPPCRTNTQSKFGCLSVYSQSRTVYLTEIWKTNICKQRFSRSRRFVAAWILPTDGSSEPPHCLMNLQDPAAIHPSCADFYFNLNHEHQDRHYCVWALWSWPTTRASYINLNWQVMPEEYLWLTSH